MLIEIGSDFHAMEVTNDCKFNIFNYLDGYNTVFFDSGRSALRTLLTFIPAKKVLLPGYICESVRTCFTESEVSYYNIDKNLQICWDDLLEKAKEHIDIVYLHFFNGYLDTSYDFKALVKLQQKYKFIIVEDTTHSLLTNKNTVGNYCICSLRKWFPIPDGGVLYSRRTIPSEDYMERNEWCFEKQKAMELKSRYLSGEQIDKGEFLSRFTKCENDLDVQSEIYKLSDISEKILEKIDLEGVMDARRKNVRYLNEFLTESKIKRVALNGLGQVPLFYTILIKNRNKIRKWLIENRIYCPVHWPLYDEIEMISDSIYVNEHELSIPIDQRYTYSDMRYIANVFSAGEVNV